VSFVLFVPATLLAHHSPPPDEAFAAKHMPDLGYDIEELQVFHRKPKGWKKLEKRLKSAAQAPTCSDRGTLRRDRLNPGDGKE